MNYRMLTKINFFLFMIWIEIIIFILSMIISVYITKYSSNFIVEKYGYKIYDSIRISTLIFLMVFFQYVYKNLIKKITKIDIKTLISIINSSAISLFFINKIIKKTIFCKYSLFYFVLFIAFISPFAEDLMVFKKIKNRLR